MLHLKFYKPLIGHKLNNKWKLNSIKVSTLKIKKEKISFFKITKCLLVWSDKICFYTKKYKTQLNVLHQSRYQLRHTLTFNKDHTWSKYTH